MAKWVTIASGKALDTLAPMVADQELKKGTPVRFELELNQPVAHFFDFAGAEHIFRGQMPEGLILKDVYGEGERTVIIEAESDPVHLVGIIAFVKLHWLAISLIAIGIAVALGFLVISIKVKSPEEAIKETKGIFIVIAIIVALVIFGYLAYKGLIPKIGT